MENPSENLSLYELISYMQDVDIPPEFESELLHYILGLSDGVEVAKMISKIFEGRGYDEISEFVDALEDHILEVMADSFVVVDSNMVTGKKLYLFSLIIHYIYKTDGDT